LKKYPIIFEIISFLNKTNIFKDFEMYAKLLEVLIFLLEKKEATRLANDELKY
jgi:hypothetical protein